MFKWIRVLLLLLKCVISLVVVGLWKSSVKLVINKMVDINEVIVCVKSINFFDIVEFVSIRLVIIFNVGSVGKI